jgi:alpha-tubulin suppressor-like RCC1 family protein
VGISVALELIEIIQKFIILGNNSFSHLFRGYSQNGNLCGINDANSDSVLPRTTLGTHASTIKSIAIGYSHTLILMANGEVLTCGENGKIGRNGIETNAVPILINPSGISKIAAGYLTSYLLGNDNTFYSFGDGSLGSLGIQNSVSISTAFPLIQNINTMTAMHSSVYLSTTSGVLFYSNNIKQILAFGKNEFYQLGNSTNDLNSQRIPLERTDISGALANRTIDQFFFSCSKTLSFTVKSNSNDTKV